MGAKAAEHEAVGVLLTRFNLSGLASALPDLEAQADGEGWNYRRFLREGLEIELQARQERKLRRLLKEAQLPEGKTLASLQTEKLTAANRRHMEELCAGGFVDRAQNVLAFGLPGRGKTHFLSAIGAELIYRQQRRVWFTPTYKLVQRLLEAKRQLKLEAALRKLDQFEAIILDDLGYVQQSREEMEVLFTFLVCPFHFCSAKLGEKPTNSAASARLTYRGLLCQSELICPFVGKFLCWYILVYPTRIGFCGRHKR